MHQYMEAYLKRFYDEQDVGNKPGARAVATEGLQRQKTFSQVVSFNILS